MRRLVKQTCSRFVFAHKSLEILKDNFCCSSLPDAKTLQRCSGENSESCRGPQEIAIFTRKIIFHRSIPVSYPYMFCGRWMFNLVLPTCQWNLLLFKDIFPYVSPSFSTGVSPIPTSLHPKKRSPHHTANRGRPRIRERSGQASGKGEKTQALVGDPQNLSPRDVCWFRSPLVRYIPHKAKR